MTNSLAVLDRPKFQFNARGRITGAAFGMIGLGKKDHCVNRAVRLFSRDTSMGARVSRLQQIVEGTFVPEYAPRKECTIGRKG